MTVETVPSGARTEDAPSAPIVRAPSVPFVAALGLVLAWGAAAGPHPFDPGELVAASMRLGGSHPPGQPLHALLGWAAIHLVPLGPIAWRVSLLSCACASVAAYLAGRIAGEILPDDTLRARGPLVANAVAMAVMLAPPLLRQAARPEVYAPSLALFAAGALELVRFAKDARDARGLFRAALFSGLLVALHPPHALALALLGIALAALRRRDVFRRGRVVAAAIGFGALGLVVLAYLPLRARAGASMWGDPTTLAGFLAYVSGAAYAMNLGVTPRDGTSLDMLRLFGVAGGGVPVLAWLASLVALPRAPRGAPILVASTLGALALVMLLPAALFPLDERIPDHVAYLGPATLLSIVAGAAVLALARSEVVAVLGLGVLAVVPTGLFQLPARAVADLPALESLGFALVDAPPPRALALVRTDFVAAQWMMDAAVDRTRPDVAVFAEGLATSSWHWAGLRGHPAAPDGEPVRSGEGHGPEPWIRGLVLRASTAVPIAAESHASVAALGFVDGPYVRTPPPDATSGGPRRMARGSGERALTRIASTLSWAAPGDHGVAAEIVRAAVVSRAERLFSRGDVEGARAALFAAAAPLAATDVQELEALDAPALRDPVPAVRDAASFYMSEEDAVRVGAALLHAAGRREAASTLLEAQLSRGDPLALLELGWLILSDGGVEQASTLVDSFVAAVPERADEAVPLMEAIARSRTGPP